jgi:hypothetical protein
MDDFELRVRVVGPALADTPALSLRRVERLEVVVLVAVDPDQVVAAVGQPDVGEVPHGHLHRVQRREDAEASLDLRAF